MVSVILVLLMVLNLYTWIIIASAILSWLVAFNVLNTQNQLVYMIMDFLHRLTEPALRPIRRIMPDLGGVDISPVILILFLFFVEDAIRRYVLPAVSNAGL